MTAYQLQEKMASQEKQRLEEEELAKQERQKKLNGPGCRDAIPREKHPFAQRQVL